MVEQPALDQHEGVEKALEHRASALLCRDWASVAKQKPLAVRPVRSSSSAGAKGSLRDQMPRCAMTMSPSFRFFSARSTRRVGVVCGRQLVAEEARRRPADMAIAAVLRGFSASAAWCARPARARAGSRARPVSSLKRLSDR